MRRFVKSLGYSATNQRIKNKFNPNTITCKCGETFIRAKRGYFHTTSPFPTPLYKCFCGRELQDKENH